MDNPYRRQPDHAFWRRAVASLPRSELDPVTHVPFHIGRHDRVATAGSCFAQHISKTLARQGFHYFVTETGPLTEGAHDESYGVYPARFGNVYTVRQLLQLFERAYGIFDPVDRIWIRPDQRFVDPFRPRIQASGFHTIEHLECDRVAHLRAVREMFEGCDVFVFTLGLTEGWLSEHDGAVVPVAPGVVASPATPHRYVFRNFSIEEMVEDLNTFAERLRTVNTDVRIVLTVSPVPLVATFEDRHVLVSTTYSKSALRVVVEQAVRASRGIAYFPSYEIITHPNSNYFQDDLRSVSPEGVAHVMSVFSRHFLREARQQLGTLPSGSAQQLSAAEESELREDHEVICDEEALDE